MTTQLVSFSKPFTPVSAPVAGFIVSVLPLRVNSITSPLAVPSNVFGPVASAISTENLSPFFVTLRDPSPAAAQRPIRESTFPAATLAAGLGETDGDEAGLDVAAGLGDAEFFTSGGLLVHADARIADAKIMANPKSQIPNRLGLLILLMFIFIGQSRLYPTG